jgi:hypothetical protein
VVVWCLVGRLPVERPDVSDEVLTELGRLTLAAIDLESTVDTVCSFIEPSNPGEETEAETPGSPYG